MREFELLFKRKNIYFIYIVQIEGQFATEMGHDFVR